MKSRSSLKMPWLLGEVFAAELRESGVETPRVAVACDLRESSPVLLEVAYRRAL